MDINADRLGKLALLAAMSDEEEERRLKEQASLSRQDIRLAVTVISGMLAAVRQNFIKSIVSCTLQNGIFDKSAPHIHGLIHAGMDAFSGAFLNSTLSGSVKLKVGIVSDSRWIAVAVYGDSAFYPTTNHERCGLGVMHI